MLLIAADLFLPDLCCSSCFWPSNTSDLFLLFRHPPSPPTPRSSWPAFKAVQMSRAPDPNVLSRPRVDRRVARRVPHLLAFFFFPPRLVSSLFRREKAGRPPFSPERAGAPQTAKRQHALAENGSSRARLACLRGSADSGPLSPALGTSAAGFFCCRILSPMLPAPAVVAPLRRQVDTPPLLLQPPQRTCNSHIVAGRLFVSCFLFPLFVFSQHGGFSFFFAFSVLGCRRLVAAGEKGSSFRSNITITMGGGSPCWWFRAALLYFSFLFSLFSLLLSLFFSAWIFSVRS